ncbi:MAG: hypothetical protein H7Y41_02850 [Hyphomonadaceae bacterium]|nr:hypothetical protein [Clostridia bacterium]
MIAADIQTAGLKCQANQCSFNHVGSCLHTHTLQNHSDSTDGMQAHYCENFNQRI